MKMLSQVAKRHTQVAALRTDLVSARIAIDPSQLTSVMGPTMFAGMYVNGQFQDEITLDADLEMVIDSFDLYSDELVKKAAYDAMCTHAARSPMKHTSGIRSSETLGMHMRSLRDLDPTSLVLRGCWIVWNT
jgi:hypothetical protein